MTSKNPLPWQSLTAGAIAGAVEISITYPAEFAKTQLQLPGAAARLGTATANPFTVLRVTIARSGLRGIYAGLSPMIVGNAGKGAVRFAAYDGARALVAGTGVLPDPAVPVVAGLVAGALEAALVVAPTERVKTVMIDTAAGSQSQSQSAVAVARNLGIAGLWRGTAAVVARQAANSGVRFGAYAAAKDRVLPGADAWYASFVRGAVAGTITVYATMPLDVAKTKLQAADAGTRYRGLVHCLLATARDHGPRALWSGATARLGRVMFSGAIAFTAYEQVMKGLQSLDERSLFQGSAISSSTTAS
ncbi:mitochondrial carrier domain-containing protein [Blastocladiella britannica]|nr:mitochondrial carrier domain-containing protein [Blastocladiella britannica]